MAGSRPAVAVVMRTKDRPVLLRRAVTDVCRQTFADWHLVVVNDGGSAAEVDEVVAGHPALIGRSTVIHNKVSRGMEAASNQALTAGDSAYVAVHDDDDTWHPSFLARTVAHLEATGDVAVAVRTEIVWEHVEGEWITERGRELMVPEIHSFTLFEMLRLNRTVPISVLYRRDVHDEVGPYREDLPVVGDWEFYLRVALTERPLGFLDGEPLAFWHQRRENDGSLANSVIAQLQEHHELDLQLREEALRSYVRRHGLGGLLYVTKYFQREIDRLHGRFTDAEARRGETLGVLAGHGELLASQGELVARLEPLLAEQAASLARQGERLALLEAAVSDASLVSLARRRYRRWKDRVLRTTSRRRRA